MWNAVAGLVSSAYNLPLNVISNNIHCSSCTSMLYDVPGYACASPVRTASKRKTQRLEKITEWSQ
jgi:hypothetical protein